MKIDNKTKDKLKTFHASTIILLFIIICVLIAFNPVGSIAMAIITVGWLLGGILDK